MPFRRLAKSMCRPMARSVFLLAMSMIRYPLITNIRFPGALRVSYDPSRRIDGRINPSQSSRPFPFHSKHSKAVPRRDWAHFDWQGVGSH